MKTHRKFGEVYVCFTAGSSQSLSDTPLMTQFRSNQNCVTRKVSTVDVHYSKFGTMAKVRSYGDNLKHHLEHAHKHFPGPHEYLNNYIILHYFLHRENMFFSHIN